jgi:uncharacterized cupredoxin-like copper-binding protein
MKIIIALSATLFAASPAFAGPGEAGHSHVHAHGAGVTEDVYVFGKPGNPKMAWREVKIIMNDADGKMVFEPSELRVKQGEQIRFQLVNMGDLKHEMVIGTIEANLAHAKEMEKNPDMEHDDPNGKQLESKKSGEIFWRFTKAGTFDFSCLVPGHRDAGMSGKIIVEARK